jgi:uncharacterized membrane protein
MKKSLILSIISILSLIGTVIVYFFLPGSIPLHWGVDGKIDGWGDRANIFWMGALPLVMILIFRFLPRIDPLRESYEKHKNAYEIIQVLMVLFFIALTWLIVAFSLGVPLDVGGWVRGGVGILFIGLGNFMGQLKRNYFIGIKTPWTLANDEVWRRTHRRGAWVFAVMGMAFIVSVFLPDGPMQYGLFALLACGIIYIFAYSYFVHRSLKKEEEPK